MELTDHQLQQLKTVELRLLREFLQVCQKLNLNYYVLGGTLLGAVRHQGFIPWDDDIDIGMPRKDYERFLSEAQPLLPRDVFLQTFATDPEYPYLFAKLRCSGTVFVEHSLKNCAIHHGIYIDIFPLDPYPEKGIRLFRLKDTLLKLRLSYTLTPEVLSSRVRLLRIPTLLLFPSRKGAVRKRDQLLRSARGTHRMSNHCGAWGEKEIVPTHWFGDGTALSFEGIPVRAPSEYRLWLTQIYGDYLRLPPEEQRVPHHFVDAFDPGIAEKF